MTGEDNPPKIPEEELGWKRVRVSWHSRIEYHKRNSTPLRYQQYINRGVPKAVPEGDPRFPDSLLRGLQEVWLPTLYWFELRSFLGIKSWAKGEEIQTSCRSYGYLYVRRIGQKALDKDIQRTEEIANGMYFHRGAIRLAITAFLIQPFIAWLFDHWNWLNKVLEWAFN